MPSFILTAVQIRKSTAMSVENFVTEAEALEPDLKKPKTQTDGIVIAESTEEKCDVDVSVTACPIAEVTSVDCRSRDFPDESGYNELNAVRNIELVDEIEDVDDRNVDEQPREDVVKTPEQQCCSDIAIGDGEPQAPSVSVENIVDIVSEETITVPAEAGQLTPEETNVMKGTESAEECQAEASLRE